MVKESSLSDQEGDTRVIQLSKGGTRNDDGVTVVMVDGISEHLKVLPSRGDLDKSGNGGRGTSKLSSTSRPLILRIVVPPSRLIRRG